jgi:hypothetical protein
MQIPVKKNKKNEFNWKKSQSRVVERRIRPMDWKDSIRGMVCAFHLISSNIRKYKKKKIKLIFFQMIFKGIIR